MEKKNVDKSYLYWRWWILLAPMTLFVSIVYLMVIVGEIISFFGGLISCIGKTLSSIDSNAFLSERLDSVILWVFKD